jgi:transposase InsO family protein
VLTVILAGIYEPGPDGRRPPECLYGSVKMWEHLSRQGITVATCTVERLMRAQGWRGVTRGRTARTTIPDPGHSRAPDLVRRNFTPAGPGRCTWLTLRTCRWVAAGSGIPRSSSTRSPGWSPGGSAR